MSGLTGTITAILDGYEANNAYESRYKSAISLLEKHHPHETELIAGLKKELAQRLAVIEAKKLRNITLRIVPYSYQIRKLH